MDTFKDNEALKPYFDSSAGYVVFEKVYKGGFKLGGAYGVGEVYKIDDGSETKVGGAKLIQVSIGWILGGQMLSEIVFFEDQRDLDRFMSGQSFEYLANADAVAYTASASASASTMGGHAEYGLKPEETTVYKREAVYNKGLAAFSIKRQGLMLEAAVGARRFSFEKS